MNKPLLIQYQRGNYYCTLRSLFPSPTGVGGTIEDAFNNWNVLITISQFVKVARVKYTNVQRIEIITDNKSEVIDIDTFYNKYCR